jgi:tight adherence protein B
VTGLLTGQGVRLFGVHLLTSEAQRAVLENLAAATSGRVAAASDARDLGATYGAVAADVVRQVRVTYRSEAAGPTPVSVMVGADQPASAPAVVDLPAAVVPPAPAPPPAVPAKAGAGALLLGGGTGFRAQALLCGLVLIRPRRSLLARQRGRVPAARQQLKARTGELVERTLERRGRRQALGARLEMAGIALRPGEYVVLVGGAATLALVTGLLLGGLFPGLLLAGAALVLARLLLRSRTTKRRTDLEKQLPDLLQQLISSLRAGYGVMQAIDAASREMADPMAGELHRLFTEVQLGRDLTESLRALSGRLAGQDFEWVVQAIEINREVGGELVEVLESVADTIRARDHLRRQVKTLSAQGRLSARILLAMPFVMAGLLSLMSPGYLTPLFSQAIGILVVGVLLMVIGWVWTRRLVRPRF